MKPVMRVVGYIRCSTIEQATDGLSLAAQRAKIETWAELAGAAIVDVFEDSAVSGGGLLADRPGGRRVAALLDARRPDVDALCIVRLDRLGRNAAETLGLLRRFQTGRVGLVSIADRVDLGSPAGRAMLQMSAVFAELEKALIGARTAEALQHLKDAGRVYGPTPYGFRAQDGHLIPYDPEQRVLKRLQHRRQQGQSYRQIARYLNRCRIPTKRGNAIWHAASVRSVLLTYASLEIPA